MLTNFYRLTWLSLCLLFLAILSNCSTKSRPNETLNEIVLKIGDFELTKYEFEKKIERLQKIPNFSAKKRQKWYDDFFDKCYFLADAYDKKYDTSRIVQLKTYYASLYMTSEVGEYYWNKVVEPKLEVNNSDIKAVYKKRDKVYYIDYIVFANRDVMISKLKGDTIIKNEKDFEKLRLSCNNTKNIWYASHALVYPYEHLAKFKDIIYGLKPGEVTKPLQSKTWMYIIHLNKIDKVALKPFKTEKENIKKELRNDKIKQIVTSKQDEIYNKTNIQVNEKTCAKLFNYITSSAKSKEDMIFGDNVLVSYLLNNKRENMTASDFLDFYYNFPFPFNSVESTNSIISNLYNLVLRKYMFAEADSLGVTKEKAFLQEKKLYSDFYMISEYYVNEILKNIFVSEQEKKDYYEKNKSSYECGTVCNAYLFYFNNMKSMMKSWSDLNTQLQNGDFMNLNDTNKIGGLISYFPNKKIENSSTDYPPKLISAIFNSELNQLSYPNTEYEGEYVLFYKTKEEGKRLQTFDEVKDVIQDKLWDTKAEQENKKRLEELKKKYTVSVNTTKSMFQ